MLLLNVVDVSSDLTFNEFKEVPKLENIVIITLFVQVPFTTNKAGNTWSLDVSAVEQKHVAQQHRGHDDNCGCYHTVWLQSSTSTTHHG